MQNDVFAKGKSIIKGGLIANKLHAYSQQCPIGFVQVDGCKNTKQTLAAYCERNLILLGRRRLALDEWPIDGKAVNSSHLATVQKSNARTHKMHTIVQANAMHSFFLVPAL